MSTSNPQTVRQISQKKGQWILVEARVSGATMREQTYPIIAGYRLKKTGLPVSPRRSRLTGLKLLILEFLLLWRQIGSKYLLNYLLYKKSPKPFYVDIIEIEQNGKKQFFQSHYGIPLQTEIAITALKQLDEIQQVNHHYTRYQITEICQKARIERVNIPLASEPVKQPSWMVVGAGNYVTSISLPSILNAKGAVQALAANSVCGGAFAAKAYGVSHIYLDMETMLQNKEAPNILIASPHFLHPDHLIASIQKQLNIYCEKPVAITREGIDKLSPFRDYKQCIVGFNRRFAPAVEYVRKRIFKTAKPLMINYLVNYGTGYKHTMMDPAIGGGLIHGVCCHYIDLIAYLAESKVKKFKVVGLANAPLENFICSFILENNTIASLTFNCLSPRDFDVKERIIINGDHCAVVINNFTSLYVNGKREKIFIRDNFGAKKAISHFQDCCKNGFTGSEGATLAEGIEMTELTLAIANQLVTQNEDWNYVRERKSEKVN